MRMTSRCGVTGLTSGATQIIPATGLSWTIHPGETMPPGDRKSWERQCLLPNLARDLIPCLTMRFRDVRGETAGLTTHHAVLMTLDHHHFTVFGKTPISNARGEKCGSRSA